MTGCSDMRWEPLRAQLQPCLPGSAGDQIDQFLRAPLRPSADGGRASPFDTELALATWFRVGR